MSLDSNGLISVRPAGRFALRRGLGRDPIYANLFDRFGPDEDPGPQALTTHLADMLGGRRLFSGRNLGVLSWGLPPLLNRVAASTGDRQYIADCIADAIYRFEPRLENVKVTPVEGRSEFTFVIEATLQEESATVSLRILSPHVGGGLGAKVEVVTIRDDF